MNPLEEVLRALMGSLPPIPGEPDWRSQRPPLTAVQRQMWAEAVEQQQGDAEAAEAIERLLASHPGTAVDFQWDYGGFGLLHMAALRNQPRLARVLLDAGAGVDTRAPSYDETPLVMAACWGCSDVIRLLLERGELAGGRARTVRAAGAAMLLDCLLDRQVLAAAPTSSPLARARPRDL